MPLNISTGRSLLYNPPASAAGPLTFTWIDSFGNTSTPAPGDIGTANIGTASSDRIVVVGITWKGTSSSNMDFTTVKIGGSGGTTATQAVYDRSSSHGTAIYYALVTSGTSAAINITGYTNGWINYFAINVGTITGSAATTLDSTVTTKSYTTSSGAGNATMTIPSGGVGVIESYIDTNTSASVSTWTGTTSSSADKDKWAGVSNSPTGSMAHVTSTSSTVNLTSCTNVSGTWGWVGAIFKP